MTKETRSILLKAVEKTIDENKFNEVLNIKTRTFMIITLVDFIEDAIDKFIEGQKKHGGSIFARDLVFERKQEAIDSFWYSAAEEHNKDLNENQI